MRCLGAVLHAAAVFCGTTFGTRLRSFDRSERLAAITVATRQMFRSILSCPDQKGPYRQPRYPMKRLLSFALVTLFATASLSAQSVPAGWKQRIDRSTNASDPDAAGDIKLTTAG